MSTRKRVTKNDILSFVYGETQASEKVEYLSQIADDQDLSDFFAEVLHLKEDLDKIELKPSAKSVKDILSYSKNYAKKEQVFVS